MSKVIIEKRFDTFVVCDETKAWCHPASVSELNLWEQITVFESALKEANELVKQAVVTSNAWSDKATKLEAELAAMKQNAEMEYQRAESIEYNKRWFQEQIVARDMLLERAKEIIEPLRHNLCSNFSRCARCVWLADLEAIKDGEK